MASAVSGKTPPPQAQPRVGTDPATSRFRAPPAQLPQHLLAGGDGVQELPLPLFHGVQQLLGAFISGRLRGWPPAEPQPRLPTVHAGSLPFSFKSHGGRGPFKLPGAEAGPRLAGRKLSSCVTSSRKRVWTDVYCASVCGAEGRCGGRHGAERWASGL